MRKLATTLIAATAILALTAGTASAQFSGNVSPPAVFDADTSESCPNLAASGMGGGCVVETDATFEIKSDVYGSGSFITYHCDADVTYRVGPQGQMRIAVANLRDGADTSGLCGSGATQVACPGQQINGQFGVFEDEAGDPFWGRVAPLCLKTAFYQWSNHPAIGADIELTTTPTSQHCGNLTHITTRGPQASGTESIEIDSTVDGDTVEVCRL